MRRQGQGKEATWKLILKRLAIWAAELISQAILLGLLLVALAGYDQHTFARDLLLAVVGILLIMFFSTGYFATTAISRAVWKWRRPWLYSVIATALFLIHFEVLNISAGGVFDIHDRVRIRIGGACIAFLSTLLGTAILRRWRALRNSGPV